jgi:hypothetical protein
MRSKKSTPWGRADQKEKVCRGINFYSTPSHGGYKVSEGMLKKMPERLRLDGGWYEEDCEAYKVIVAFPQYFTEALVVIAKRNVEKYYDEKGNWKNA